MKENVEIKQTEKKRGKKRGLILKIFGGIIAALVLFLGIVFVVHVISKGLEKDKIEAYGQYVQVDGKKMNVSIQGAGEQTIVSRWVREQHHLC